MKKINNLNEEINRIKSLFTEERLFGNLVEKELITEQRKVLFQSIAKSWDDAAKALRSAGKRLPPIKNVVKDEFFERVGRAKSIDDMKVIFKNTDFDAMWKVLGYNDNQIGNIRKVLIEHGGDMSKMVGDVPIYTYITRKNGMRDNMLTMWFMNADDAAKRGFLEVHYSGKITGLEKTDDAVEFVNKVIKQSEETKSVMKDVEPYKPKVKPDEPIPVKPDEPTPVKPDEPTPVKPDEPTPVKPDEPKVKPKNPEVIVRSPKQLVKRVDDIVEKGYIGEITFVREGAENVTAYVGKYSSGADVVDNILDDLTKGMGRKQKKAFKKVFMEEFGDDLVKDINKKYVPWKKMGKFLIGDWGPKGNWLVGAKKGDAVWEKILSAGGPLGERLVKIYFVTIGGPMSIYYSITSGEFNHPFYFRDGGYLGRILSDLKLEGLLNTLGKESWDAFCTTTKEATNKVFDCAIIESEIYSIQKEIALDMDCLEDGATEDDYKKAFNEKMTKSAYLGRIKKELRDSESINNEDYNNNESMVQTKLLEVFGTYIPDGTFNGKNFDNIITAKMVDCNQQRMDEKDDSKGDDVVNVTYDVPDNSDDVEIGGEGEKKKGKWKRKN